MFPSWCDVKVFHLFRNMPNHTDVSKNMGTPKSSILIGFFIINDPFWGTPIFGNTHTCKCLWPLWLLSKKILCRRTLISSMSSAMRSKVSSWIPSQNTRNFWVIDLVWSLMKQEGLVSHHTHNSSLANPNKSMLLLLLFPRYDLLQDM